MGFELGRKEKCGESINHLRSEFPFHFFLCLFILRESEQGEGWRERESQAGSMLSVQSPMQGSIS